MGIEGASHYFSFLLRLWQVHTEGENALRILLENVQTGEMRGFASLGELFAYLDQVIEQDIEISGEVGDTGLHG
jgi:hypothetical protein